MNFKKLFIQVLPLTIATTFFGSGFFANANADANIQERLLESSIARRVKKSSEYAKELQKSDIITIVLCGVGSVPSGLDRHKSGHKLR